MNASAAPATRLTIEELKHEMRRGLSALLLEAPADVVRDLSALVAAVVDAQDERLRAVQAATAATPIEPIEMEDWSKGYAEPAEPIWRITLNGYCADFPSEGAARNFAAQIAALVAAVATSAMPGLVAALRELVAIWAEGGDETREMIYAPHEAWHRARAALAAVGANTEKEPS